MAQLQLPHVDASALRERVREVDLSRLAELGDELRRMDVAEGIRSLDLEGLRHLGDSIERPEVDLAAIRDLAVVRRVQRALGREPKRNLWDSLPGAPPLGATVIAGALVVLAGAALGGLVAWFYQPRKGEVRRKQLRRRLRRATRRSRGLRPA